MGMSRIHLEERQVGAFDHRTLVTIVQRSVAKLGQALSLAYVHKGTAERSGA